MTERIITITVTPTNTPGLVGFDTEIFGQLTRQVASLQDEIVRDQLVAAGWMPPPANPGSAIEQPSGEDLYWMLHSISKAFEGSDICEGGNIGYGEISHYAAILEAMNFVRQAKPESAAERQLAEIRKAISDYHLALDSREHGGVAQDRAFNRIREVLDMLWQPGREKAERAAAAVSPCPGRTAAASAE